MLKVDGKYVIVDNQRAVMFFGWVFFLISLGSPQVHLCHHHTYAPWGWKCGEPTEIGLTGINPFLNSLRYERAQAAK